MKLSIGVMKGREEETYVSGVVDTLADIQLLIR